MNYLKVVAKGVFWTGSSKFLTRLVGFVRIAILARLLTPIDFGVYGVAALVLAFMEIITETGINVFLVQGEGFLKDYIDTAWIVSILRGLFIFALLFIASGTIAVFFASQNAELLIKLVGVVALIRGFINPAVVSLQKELKFKKEFFFQFSLFAVETVTALFFAYTLRSPAALVYAMIASALVEVYLSFVIFELKPRFDFQISRFKHVISRGKWVTLTTLSRYGFEEIDDIIVGKFLRTELLGIYQVAYRISSLPLTEIGQVFGKVTFPVYVRMRSDKRRLRSAYLRTVLTITFLAIPFGLVFYFLPELVITLLLGEQWFAATSILKALAVFGVMKAVVYTAYPLFNAMKLQERVATATFISFMGMIVTIFPLIARFGMVGAAYAATTGLILSIPYTFITLRKVLFT